jgi:hypothetical protein
MKAAGGAGAVAGAAAVRVAGRGHQTRFTGISSLSLNLRRLGL